MIYTVTMNPSLDYVVRVEPFETGEVNRTRNEQLFCGGKGINVSAVLSELGLESRLLGFVAGFTGNEILRRVRAMGLQEDFIRLKEGRSRINIKLKSDKETEINGQGPEIGEGEMEALFEKVKQLEKGDVLVLSGSVPPSAGQDIYSRMMELVSGKNVLTAVDGSGELLLHTLPLRPFVIKPNLQELRELLDVSADSTEEIKACASRLQKMGARNVLVSMAGQGALLLAEDGAFYRQAAAKGQVKNSVGAGDSMTAGFLAGYLKTGDYQYALKLGTACGGATAFSDGLAKGEEIRRLMDRLL